MGGKKKADLFPTYENSFIWKNSRMSGTNLHFFWSPLLIFELRGVRGWKCFWKATYPGTLIRTRPHPPYVPPHGRYVAGNPGHTPNWPKFWPQIFNICWPSVPGGCTYWPALRGMKGTYIGFQSMVVSILDHVFKYRSMGLVSGAPENGLFSPFLPK